MTATATTVHWKTADGVEIHCRLWDVTHDQSPPEKEIWLVHGLGDHGGRYDDLAQALNRRGFRVIVADHRGNGQSGGKRGHANSLAQLLDDLQLTIEKTKSSAQRKFILGQSMGGLVVARLLMLRQVDFQGAVLLSPLFRTFGPRPNFQLFIARFLRILFPSLTFSAKFRADELTSSETKKNLYRRDENKHGRISAALGVDLFDEGEEAISNADHLEIPTLVMHGSVDRITCPTAAREFVEKCSTAEFKLWSDKRHELHNEEDNQLIVEYLIKWMEDL